MVKQLKLRQDSADRSARLAKDLADRLTLAPRDKVLAVEAEQGILLSPYDPNVEEALAIAAQTANGDGDRV